MLLSELSTQNDEKMHPGGLSSNLWSKQNFFLAVAKLNSVPKWL